MSNHNFSLRIQNNIKEHYLKSEKPIDIAKDLGLKAMEVHNFIQSKQLAWIDEHLICTICGVGGDKHLRCDSCESLIHDFNYNIINNKKICSYCAR